MVYQGAWNVDGIGVKDTSMCCVYGLLGCYKAWFIWGGVVRMLEYMAGVSNIGWIIHSGGVGKTWVG